MARFILLQFVRPAFSVVAYLRRFLLLYVVSIPVVAGTEENEYTVITSSDKFPPASFLHVVTRHGLSHSTTVNVWLAAGETFLLVDKTAKLMHSPAHFKLEAYSFTNKKCDFGTTVRLPALFPLVSSSHAFWTQPIVNSPPASTVGRGTTAVFWKFWNPTKDVINKKITTFCYRFLKAATSYNSERVAAVSDKASTNATADEARARTAAGIWPGKDAVAKGKQSSTFPIDHAENASVLVLIIHSGAFGWTSGAACTILLFLPVSIALWLAA